MENLFDVAHADALTLIKIKEDKDFLISQRKPGRPGSLLAIDKSGMAKEKRKTLRIEKEISKRKKFEESLLHHGM
jgi:hypothetical protein